MNFNELWNLLYQHGASAKKEEGTRRFWNTLTPQQQSCAFTTISNRLKEGKFVQYDPIRAINESLRPNGKQKPTPTNLNGTLQGAEMLNTNQAKTAFYNGKWGLYSLEDIQLFNLKTLN